MAKVVGLSGAQGGGKSTLLSGLKDLGWVVDDFKVSRFVQAKLGFSSLAEATSTPEAMMTFQREVFAEKLEHDVELTRSEQSVVLVERTFSDIAAYSCRWGWDMLDNGKLSLSEAHYWASFISRECVKCQKIYAAVLLLPYMGHITWINDARRAPRESADSIFEEVERFQEKRELFSQPRFRITAESVEDRIIQVDAYLRTL